MFETVDSVRRKEAALINTIPALAAAFNQFSDMLAELRKYNQLQLQNLKGITENKNNSRAKLCRQVQVISGMLKSWASDVGNYEVVFASNYSPSTLRNMRNHQVFSAVSLVCSIAEQHITDLEPYGMTTQLWENFISALNDYEDKMIAPTLAIRNRKAYTSIIDEIDADIRKHLRERIDTAILVLEESNPMFVARYKAARAIYNFAATHKKHLAETDAPAVISGTITDTSGAPVPGASVQLDGTGLITTTSPDGNFNIAATAGQKALILISKTGYIPALQNNIPLHPGLHLTRNFILSCLETG